MKIVVNRCFGGFGLSNLAKKEYLKLKNKDAFFYEQTKFLSRDGEKVYTRVDEDLEDSGYCYCFTEDLGRELSCLPESDSYFWDEYIERDDVDLIKVVEKLGERANGDCADLEVVDIPDYIKWKIREYDGIESIHECRRSW